MKKLVQIIVAVLCALLLCSGGGEAARGGNAKVQGMTSYAATVDGVKVQRIEIALSKANVKFRAVKEEEMQRQILIELEKTDLHPTEPLLSVNDGGVSSVLAHEANGNVRLRVKLNHRVAPNGYRIYLAAAERRARKPERLIIDIYPAAWGESARELRMDGHIVVLDPGHGGSDTGAVGPNGLTEKEVTFAVAQKLRRILEGAGTQVVMTRESDTDVYAPHATNGQELGARAQIANRTPGAELFLSIHCNGFRSPAAHGMETYYYTGSFAGERFAALLNEELEAAGGRFNRGVKDANFYVLKHTNMPASLVELAFITNYEEEELLGDASYQQKMADALARGIARYFAGE